jgi:hypothetical protein
MWVLSPDARDSIACVSASHVCFVILHPEVKEVKHGMNTKLIILQL